MLLVHATGVVDVRVDLADVVEIPVGRSADVGSNAQTDKPMGYSLKKL